MMSDLSLDAWALFTCVMFMKFFVNSAIQASLRFKHKAFSYPEDRKFLALSVDPGPVPASLERVAAAWRNDLENVPIAIVLLLAATMLGAKPIVVTSLCCLFSASRLGHLVALMMAAQPWRNLSYQLGILTLFATVVQILWLVLERH